MMVGVLGDLDVQGVLNRSCAPAAAAGAVHHVGLAPGAAEGGQLRLRRLPVAAARAVHLRGPPHPGVPTSARPLTERRLSLPWLWLAPPALERERALLSEVGADHVSLILLLICQTPSLAAARGEQSLAGAPYKSLVKVKRGSLATQ